MIRRKKQALTKNPKKSLQRSLQAKPRRTLGTNPVIFPSSLCLVNIDQLVTLRGEAGPRRGAQLNDIGLVRDGAVLCAGGKIVAAGTSREVMRNPWFRQHRKRIPTIDCAGKTVLPGFVDSHTHLIFAKPRLEDFELRIAGAGYEEIAASGGGIQSSVAAVRSASEGELAARARRSLTEMLRQGTTTVEAKSGYGLSPAAEMKSLRAIRDAAEGWPGTVVPTLLGAHIVPHAHRARRGFYLTEICEKMIPEAARLHLARFVDVFCERGAFSGEECEIIFAAAASHKLGMRAHAGQFTSANLEPLLKFAPSSFDHLDYCDDDQLALLAASRTVATLLPAATFFLGRENYPRARRMIETGIAVALATDYNPGTSPTTSMPLVITIACTRLKMTVAEAISAATINGAHALNLGDSKGSLVAGKDADLAIFDVEDHREIPYWFGANHCVATVCGGIVTNT